MQRLERAGFTREQATAFAEAQCDVFDEVIETSLATKADIQRLENQSHADIQRLENRIEQMELRLTVKLGAFMAVGIGAVATMLRFH